MTKWSWIYSILIPVGAVLLVLAGCSTQKEAVAPARKLSLDEVMSNVRARYAFVKTLRGNGSITAEGRQSSQSGSFDVDLKKPDSVLVELHGPFGIHVGTLSLSRDTFVFFNRMANNAVIGRPDGRTLRTLFHLNMQFDELLNAFTGEFPLTMEGDTLERFYPQEDEYIAVFRTMDGDSVIHKEYRIDRETFIVDSYRLLNAQNRAFMIANASRPMKVGDIEMPRLLRVVFPNERRSVTISYDKIRLNEPVACSFSLPDRVPRTYQ